MARKYGAGAAAFQPPSSAGTEPVNLADRRRAKALARVDRDCANTIAMLERAKAQGLEAERLLADIAKSKRAHPSNPRIYDREGEG